MIIREPEPLGVMTYEHVEALGDVQLGELADRVKTELKDTYGPQLNMVQREIAELVRRGALRRDALAAEDEHSLAKRVAADTEHTALVTVRRRRMQEATDLNEYIAVLRRVMEWAAEIIMARRRSTCRTSEGREKPRARRAHKCRRSKSPTVSFSFYPGPPRG